jgi:hypothetical protein
VWTISPPLAHAVHLSGSGSAKVDVTTTLPNANLVQTVTVSGGSFSLPFLGSERTDTIQGDPGTHLAGYLSETVTVPQATIDSSTAPGFATP